MDKFLKLIPQNVDKLKKDPTTLPNTQPQKKEEPKDRGPQPWVEKYRPNKLDDVVYQTNVVNALKNTKQTGKMPHLLLYGPPGTGKTSTILALAKELFGEKFRDRVLELNASDERGIQVVRDKIKKYSQRLVSKINDRNVPNFQIVILDEADSMTEDAQSALRRVIEDHVKTTRFCFICNYVSKIIDPIASRCAKYRFSPLTKETQMARLLYISENEKLPIDSSILSFLIDISEGDLRRSINLLQGISQLGSDLMSQEVINDVCGIIPGDEIEALFEVMRFKDAEEIMKGADGFFLAGYDLRQFLIQFNDFVMFNDNLSDDDKRRICEIVLDAECGLLEGASVNLKLYDFMMEVRNIFVMS